ncbi:hypothetical protein [Pseudoxanthomonas kaohsiungensis]|uniref:Uncharacterized protein n=1 Tax=Pseudoxanthomonas kaohsiungensis TaxID=283923 RepID=A0ABW3LY24_9GAMM|nr:hypothetical protein [Pseudoxanthomonas kaohsiungensis]KAF1702964.1 hypothetical protein CSC66_09320 [Pseudoxanthomonas kaohsiungensis]
MLSETIPFRGFITLAFADQVGRTELALGVAGFLDLTLMDQQFEELSAVIGASAFTARKVVGGQVIAHKPVSVELVEGLLQAPVAELIQRARKSQEQEELELERAIGMGCPAF